MNAFENIPAESEFRDSMTQDCREIEPALTPEEITEQQEAMAEARSFADEPDADVQGWPGDGSGMDDLADYNANEADDYSNE